ncbi:hypothetical protein ACO0LI_28265 [Undibacterium sp. Tian12W]
MTLRWVGISKLYGANLPLNLKSSFQRRLESTGLARQRRSSHWYIVVIAVSFRSRVRRAHRF